MEYNSESLVLARPLAIRAALQLTSTALRKQPPQPHLRGPYKEGGVCGAKRTDGLPRITRKDAELEPKLRLPTPSFSYTVFDD